MTWYGACGVEFCGDCLPRFDESNNEITEPEAVREAFALGAAWALGDDEGTLADLREQVEMLTAQRDNAERKHERLESAVEALANEWERTHRDQLPHLGCLDMYRHCAELLRALLPGGVAGVTLPAHHLLDANLSMTCTNCGGHTELTPPCIPARTLAGEVG